MDPLNLGKDSCLHILGFLDAHSVSRALAGSGFLPTCARRCLLALQPPSCSKRTLSAAANAFRRRSLWVSWPRRPSRQLALPFRASPPLSTATQLLALGACSREWRELTADEGLWQALCQRDQPSLAAQHSLATAAGATWRDAYARAHRLQALRRVRWQPEGLPGGRRPRPREGHAACAWGRRSLLLHGGFGGGILRDCHILAPAPPSSPHSPIDAAAASGSGSDSDAPGSSSGGAGSGGPAPAYRWVQPRLAGAAPLPRYGHTLSRCVGPDDRDMAVIFGGLLAGGYQVCGAGGAWYVCVCGGGCMYVCVCA